MSEQEINTYRFTSGNEPTDDMLAQLMKEVAQEAKERQELATSTYFNTMHVNAEAKKAKWAERINNALNGR